MLDIEAVRARFPALARTCRGLPLVFFDGPGGTQVPQDCIEGVVDYLSRCNANHGGAFATSVESDALIAEAHEAMADFLNARHAEEIVFGANMTTLTFALSRVLGSTLGPGDEVVLTVMDHDANFSPWYLMAQERGAVVRTVDIHPEDCTLDLEGLRRALSPRTRLVAVGLASNAVGTVNPVWQIAELAREVGALSFVDAVHYAPHGPIDVQDLECDFLVCSPYKFFGPHLGVLYGRLDLLQRLPAYKVRPADHRPPGKYETGTQSGESLAGLLGTVHYLEWLGRAQDGPAPGRFRSVRAATLHRAMLAAQAWERALAEQMLAGLSALRGVRLYGISEGSRLHERVPTFAIRVSGHHPRRVAELLAEQGICVWDGNYYAINLTERLGVEADGGMVRIGLAHYNTGEEVDRLLTALATLSG